MTNQIDVIDSLSITKTGQELWNDLNLEYNIKQCFLYFPPQTSWTIRLLAPFIKCRRLYIDKMFPFQAYIALKNNNIAEANKIINETINESKIITNRINDNINNNSSELHTPMFIGEEEKAQGNLKNYNFKTICKNIIQKFHNKNFWQKCILANVYIHNTSENEGPKIKIIALTSNMLNIRRLNEPIRNMVNSMSENRINIFNQAITGINAHDITITRLIENNNDYHISVAPKATYLSKSDIEYIINHGLFDIKNIIKDNQRIGNYIYSISSDYKLSNEECQTVLNEISQFQEDKHIQDVEEHINNIPKNAFENINDAHNAIHGLEL